MKENEARELLSLGMIRLTHNTQYDDVIAEAKRRGLIDQNPLEKWNVLTSRAHPWDYNEMMIGRNEEIASGNAMRDYLLSELAKKQRVGCGKRRYKNDVIECGDIGNTGVYLCDDCIKLMRADGKEVTK